MANTDDKRKRNGARKRNDDEQVDLLGISRRDKLLHGIVYALIILGWIGIVIWNVVESGCWSSQQPRTTCIIDAVGSIDKAVFPALMLTIVLIVTGRSTRAAFRRMLMVLPVLRDKYEENLQAAEARGATRGREEGVEIGEARGVDNAKQWYERKQRAEQSGGAVQRAAPVGAVAAARTANNRACGRPRAGLRAAAFPAPPLTPVATG